MLIVDDAKADKAFESIQVGAVKGGAIGLVFGGTMAAFLQYGIKSQIFRNLTTPGKVFLISSSAIAGFWIGAEKSLTNYIKSPYGERWGNARDAPGITLEQKQQIEANSSSVVNNTEMVETTTQKPPATFLGMDQKSLLKYRYHIVGGVWVASVAGSLAWTFRQKHLRTSQKLIQARVYAQFMTITALLGTAFLTQLPGFEEEKEDEEEPWMRKKY